MRRTLLPGLLLLLVALTGCQPTVRKVSVSGSAHYAQAEIAEGEIVLTPVAGTSGPESGTAIRSGKYEIAACAGVRPGGTYRVAISGFEKSGRKIASPFGGPDADLMDNVIPPQYNVHSELLLQVPTDIDVLRHDFDLPAATYPKR